MEFAAHVLFSYTGHHRDSNDDASRRQKRRLLLFLRESACSRRSLSVRRVSCRATNTEVRRGDINLGVGGDSGLAGAVQVQRPAGEVLPSETMPFSRPVPPMLGLAQKRHHPKSTKHHPSTSQRQASIPRKRRFASSLFTGVTRTRNGRWQAQISIAGKQTYLGTFNTEQAAAKVRSCTAH